MKEKIDVILDKLSKSKFRSSFKLKEKDLIILIIKELVQSKSMRMILLIKD